MNTNGKRIIGVVGGVGPYAGIDLVQKIFNQTKATCDQEHLPVSMLSVPGSIPDRTEFLLGKGDVNPALAISEVICTLYQQGASVVGMSCNTAHAAPILNEIIDRIPREVKLVSTIHSVAKYIKEHYPSIVKVGILSTTGTFLSNVYPDCLSEYGLVGIQVSEEIQEFHVQPAIYDRNYGIKAHSNPVTTPAKRGLLTGVEYMIEKGVEAIILGCSELPLALKYKEFKEVPLIDTTQVLARALILEASPEDLLE